MPDRPWQDREWLVNKYHGEKLSCTDIADEMGCSDSTIQKWMNRHDIERRDIAEIRQLSDKYGNTAAGYRTNSSGYVEVYSDFHSERDSMYIHRLLAVAEFGADAVADKQVHHISHIPWDNRPENIELIGASEHKTKHLNIKHGHEPMPDL